MTLRIWIFGTQKLSDAEGKPLVEMVKAHTKAEAIVSLLLRHPRWCCGLTKTGAPVYRMMRASDWDYIDVADMNEPMLDPTKRLLQ